MVREFMTRSGWLAGIVVVGLALSGCNRHTPAAPAAPSESATGPSKPAANANEFVWGDYLAAQGKLHAKDIQMRPVIYVIPSGDSVAAVARRKEEGDSIRSSVGPILVPGGLLIIGGPDSRQTSTFVADLSKAMKPKALTSIVVMVVGDAAQQSAVTGALKPTGALVRYVTM